MICGALGVTATTAAITTNVWVVATAFSTLAGCEDLRFNPCSPKDVVTADRVQRVGKVLAYGFAPVTGAVALAFGLFGLWRRQRGSLYPVVLGVVSFYPLVHHLAFG